MICGKLIFSQSVKWETLSTVFSLPAKLRPSTVSVGEDDAREPIGPEDDLRQRLGWRSGFFLDGPNVSYDFSMGHPEKITCNCYFHVLPRLAESFLIHMATANPLFAYVSDCAEAEARNRITNSIGPNTIESWVGRDISRYLPGLYWLTLLPDTLAARHGISIEAIKAVALQHRELDGGQHLFRFYEAPQDWQNTNKIVNFCSSTPGFFNIDRVKLIAAAEKDLMTYMAAVGTWK